MTNYYERMRREMERYFFYFRHGEIAVLKRAIDMVRTSKVNQISLTDDELFVLDNSRFDKYPDEELTEIGRQLKITKGQARQIRIAALRKVLMCYIYIKEKDRKACK